VESYIEFDTVSKSYGTKLAVRELSLKIPKGELFACLGPNGAGKTTAIKMITGLLRPTHGSVFVMGHNTKDDSEEVRRHISYIPDEPHLYEKLSGREFFEFTRDIYGLSNGESNDYAEELIEVFEMRDYIDNVAETYSHGMRQRVVFAAALLHRPKVMVVDEPMVGLDPKSVRVVKDLLRESSRNGTAIFMSTHTLAIAEEMADRVGIIDEGRLIRCGTIDELREEGEDGVSLEELFLKATAKSED